MNWWLVAKIPALLLVLVVGAAGTAAYTMCSKFDASMELVYDVPVPDVVRSTDPAVVARGDHVVHSIAACAAAACHGEDLAGADKPTAMGPLGQFAGPNITGAGLGAAYSDGELARIIKHGIKKDGTSVRFMPSQDLSWLPEGDVVAVVSYLRTVPDVDRPNEATVVAPLGKVLDRCDQVVWDVARRIDHAKVETPPAPQPTAVYGAYIARHCSGCHGEHFSGGAIPGAPSSIPVPPNLTPDRTGLAAWTFADFERLMRTGVRKNGDRLDPFMPIETWKNLDDTEMRAVFAYLRSLPPRPRGGR
jgi:cytochrome c553